MSTAVESEPVPKLGLAELDPAELPYLEVVARNTKGDIVADVGAQLAALIVSPQNRVLYLEAVSTSDAGAHALMGRVSDPRGCVEFRFHRAGEAGDYVEITPPASSRVANVRLAVNASETFHSIVAEHVGAVGIPRRSAA